MPRDPDTIIEADYQAQVEKKAKLDSVNDESISELFAGEPERKQYDEIPELTYASLHTQYEAADYIVITIFIPGSCGPHYNRSKHADRVWNGFTATYTDWVDHDYELYRAPGHVYGKFTTETITHPDFPGFEGFLEQYIESWGVAAITSSFERGILGRSNTIVYDRRDNKPPHPESKRGQKRFETDREKMELLTDWKAYERNGSNNPRYEYRPLYEVNGDYGLKGMDVAVWAVDKLGVNVRMNISGAHVDSATADPGRAGPYPDARLRNPSRADVEAINPDFETHLTVTQPSVQYTAPNSTSTFPH